MECSALCSLCGNLHTCDERSIDLNFERYALPIVSCPGIIKPGMIHTLSARSDFSVFQTYVGRERIIAPFLYIDSSVEALSISTYTTGTIVNALGKAFLGITVIWSPWISTFYIAPSYLQETLCMEGNRTRLSSLKEPLWDWHSDEIGTPKHNCNVPCRP